MPAAKKTPGKNQPTAAKSELYQAYDTHGLPVKGKSLTKDEAYAGALHAAAHVWIWRRAADGSKEVLLQKRGSAVRTWPGRWDISAAGHIDLGETELQAALREMKEELQVAADPSRLVYIGCHRRNMAAGDAIENEYGFLYTLELKESDDTLTMQAGEVAKLSWKPLTAFQREVLVGSDTEKAAYVPHGAVYFAVVLDALREA